LISQVVSTGKRDGKALEVSSMALEQQRWAGMRPCRHFRAKGGARAIIQALSSAKECVKNKSENAWQQRIGGAATRASSLQS
jgi:hypothetical protein